MVKAFFDLVFCDHLLVPPFYFENCILDHILVDFVLEYQVEPRSRKHELFEELNGDESVNEAYYGLVSHKEPSNFGEDFPGRIFQKLLSGELAALSQIIEKLELLLDDLELLLLVINPLVQNIIWSSLWIMSTDIGSWLSCLICQYNYSYRSKSYSYGSTIRSSIFKLL